MIKILPIILIPIFFFTFYFNVIFLTDSNSPEMENLEVKSKSKNLINNENRNISVILDENQNKDEQENIDMKSDNQSEKMEKTDINKKVNDDNFVKNIENTVTNDTTKRT